MSSSGITESTVEEAALDWLDGLGWSVAHGPDIAPDTLAAERADYGQVVLERRLRDGTGLCEINNWIEFSAWPRPPSPACLFYEDVGAWLDFSDIRYRRMCARTGSSNLSHTDHS